MKRFINDIRKYYKYSMVSIKSGLKSEVANSHLGWLWWILDPLLFMLIYVFIGLVVFDKAEPYFETFVFIGLSMWNFFSKSVTKSVKIVQANSAIVSKVYIPKYILILIEIGQLTVKMLISFSLVVIMMTIRQVPITWNVLFLLPILVNLFLITFGVSTIIAHYGVYVEDLKNIITVVLKLTFYMTGIFYDIERRVPGIYGTLLAKYNPIAYLITACRQSLLRMQTPNLYFMGAWFVIGIIISVLGIWLIYKNENSYVKIM